MSKSCVSIIVPVYNQESMIERCLNSILMQTYKELQILIIDDGSSDGTAEILDYFAAADTRIEVYHVQNQGVSASRNYGLYRVKGEYVQFVDADDYIAPCMVADMVAALEQSKADMVVCNYYKLIGKWEISNCAMDRGGIYTNKQYLHQTVQDPGHHYYGVVWNKIYKASILQQKHLQFRSDVTLGEDFIFNLNYWSNCRLVKVIGKKNYYYNRTNTNSLSFNAAPGIADCISEYENRKKIFEEYTEILKKSDEWTKYYNDIYFYWIVFLIRQRDSLKFKYKEWTESDKNKWNEILTKDENITEAVRVTNKCKRFLYWCKYSVSRRCKDLIKCLTQKLYKRREI